MIHFQSGMDCRSREPKRPTVARVTVAPGDVRYCVIGTEYGHVHTTAGDVRTWHSYSGARQFARAYERVSGR